MKTIAVIGASGFVGTTLVERLTTGSRVHRVLPFIHSSGNAMGIARRGLELRALDLLDAAAVNEALKGATHVVNCSRGGNDVMVSGLRNLLAASRTNGVARFIHLSSVAVYGDPPSPDSDKETGRTAPEPGSYGAIKLEQDRLVMRAAQSGLSSVVLCPPNISGPGSYFLGSLVEALRSGTFAMLEDGSAPCNLVDVNNLAHAIELAFENGPADGRRMFVTDDENTTWNSVVAAVMPLTECKDPPPIISRKELLNYEPQRRRAISVLRSIKHLVSSEVRAAMRKDPLWAKVDGFLRNAVATMGRPFEDRLRLSVEGPMCVPKVEGKRQLSPLTRQQLRNVIHSCSLGKERLGYRPVYTVTESMAGFRKWYRAQHCMDTTMWPLLRQLYV